ncbi:MAG: hypothetical protein HFG28_11695 [Eubacterium sp.]|nr:hypothetical protein [Eubacterium sp.]
MASGDLFRAFTVRFSFKKEQHVRMLQKFEDRKLTDGKTKNQVVMDALEMYFDALENNNETKEDKWVTKEFLEQRLGQSKQEFKEEIWKEFICILVDRRMAGQPFMAVSSNGEPASKELIEDEMADIGGMPDVMNKIMDWSES